MVLQAFGERERFSDEAGTALSEGAPEPFDVIGQAVSLAGRDVLMGGDHRLIGQEEVGAAQGVVADLFGQRHPQAFGGEVRPVSDNHRQHSPGFGIQYRPDPEDLLLGTHETPQFVGFDYDRDFFCGWFRRVGWRIGFPPGVVAVESVDEIPEPAPGNPDGSGNGPQGQAFTEQTENEGFFLLGDRADFWMLDELPLATSAEKFRCARIVRTIANHMRGGTVWTGWMDTSR